jgi:hypothetical protein
MSSSDDQHLVKENSKQKHIRKKTTQIKRKNSKNKRAGTQPTQTKWKSNRKISQYDSDTTTTRYYSSDDSSSRSSDHETTEQSSTFETSNNPRKNKLIKQWETLFMRKTSKKETQKEPENTELWKRYNQSKIINTNSYHKNNLP